MESVLSAVMTAGEQYVYVCVTVDCLKTLADLWVEYRYCAASSHPTYFAEEQTCQCSTTILQ